jgi:hypothetical protein
MNVVLPEPVMPITAIIMSSELRVYVSRAQFVVAGCCYLLKRWRQLDLQLVLALYVYHRGIWRFPHGNMLLFYESRKCFKLLTARTERQKSKRGEVVARLALSDWCRKKLPVNCD